MTVDSRRLTLINAIRNSRLGSNLSFRRGWQRWTVTLNVVPSGSKYSGVIYVLKKQWIHQKAWYTFDVAMDLDNWEAPDIIKILVRDWSGKP